MSIKKIASMAGVSYSTVSRVLNFPDYKCSSPKTREKILEAARKLNYIPNEAARNLKLGITGTKKIYYIGILVTRTESANVDPFFSELTRIVESEIHNNTCILSQIWYHSSFSSYEQNSNIDTQLIVKNMAEGLTQKIDGLIIIGKCNSFALKALKQHFKNIVSLSRNSTNYEVDEVLCDGRNLATTAVEYLIHLGHRKIGYIGSCHHETRFYGYRETLFKYNIENDINYIIEVKQSEEQGYKIMEQLIHQDNAPTGIYCANDIIAVGMIKCLNKYKNRYYNPSIISSDDIDKAQYTKPMLTTVRVPKNDMAKFALYLLYDRINGGHKTAAKIELQGSLIIRESCSSVENSMHCEYYI